MSEIQEKKKPKKKKKKKPPLLAHEFTGTSAKAASLATPRIPTNEEEEDNLDAAAPSLIVSPEPPLDPLQPDPVSSALLPLTIPPGSFHISPPAEDEPAEPTDAEDESAEPTDRDLFTSAEAEPAEATEPMPSWQQYAKSKPPILPPDVKEEPGTPTPLLPPKIFDLWTAFYTQPKLEWSEFKTLVSKLGIGIIPNGGSIRRLTYSETTLSRTGRNHIVVHEPHGVFTTLGPFTLSYLRKVLWDDFGWTVGSFACKQN